jgi:hypothetical protein
MSAREFTLKRVKAESAATQLATDCMEIFAKRNIAFHEAMGAASTIIGLMIQMVPADDRQELAEDFKRAIDAIVTHLEHESAGGIQ